MRDLTTPPFAPIRTSVERRPDGSVLIRSADELRTPATSMAHLLRACAASHPDRLLATERDGDGWRTMTWGQAGRDAEGIAQALLDRGLGPDRPVMVLSGNSLAHLRLMLGAYCSGVPIVPLSPAYSLLSADHARVRAVAELCRPGLVFADDAGAFGPALDALAPGGAPVLVCAGERPGAERLADLAATTPGASSAEAFGALGPQTVAKLLLTSGSTGSPKAVVNTHGMLCANQQALAQVWPFLTTEPPVLVDWLPWSHTFGGNHNLGQVLAFGGTLHIDAGRPTPQLFERTVEAVREARPSMYYNVPAGFAMLAPRLEQDRELAEAFFSRLRFMCYAAAALPQQLWERLRALADDVADHPVALTSSWGMTESAPAATTAHAASAPCGCIGVPLPGVTLKLSAVADKLEIRLKGPSITPGYLRDAAASAAAFDEEGFFCTGDAGRLVDPDDGDAGLLFDGRLSEDFKLATGTWVAVGALRLALLSACGDLLTDAVITGHGRDYVAALVWVDPEAASRLTTHPVDRSGTSDPAREILTLALRRLNLDRGSSSRIERLLVLEAPADLDAGEITDKGYVNQRRVLERRAESVDRLHADPPDDRVIVVGGA